MGWKNTFFISCWDTQTEIQLFGLYNKSISRRKVTNRMKDDVSIPLPNPGKDPAGL